MVDSIRLITAGMVLLISIYYAKARTIEKSPKNNWWKRERYHIQVNISLEKEDVDLNPGIDHTVTHLPTTKPHGSKPPTTPPGSSPTRTIGSKPPSTPPGPSPTTTAISSSLFTTRPIDWQPDTCDRYPLDSRSLPKMGKKGDFKPGPPFTEKEIQDALLATIVTNNAIKLPCSAIFPHNESSSRGIINPNWPNAEIPYEIDSGLTVEQRQMIIKAMEEIKNRTCLTFPPRNNHVNWMRIAAGTTGCYATNLGAGGTPPVEISLNPVGCFYHGTIVHEILHVAGLAHEQTRTDRDQYVTILWENIKEKKEHNFCKRKNIVTGHPYDYASIMHYGEYSFSTDKGVLKTIDAKENTIGLREEMSQGDVDQVNYVYCNKTFECETGWQKIDYTTKQYCFTKMSTDWYSAYAHCQRYGAEAGLAILDTESKRSDVATHMVNIGYYYAWVGANSNSGTFKWLDGHPVRNESWYVDTVPTPVENRCVYTGRFRAPSTLRDLQCYYQSSKIFILCEK